MLRSTQSWVSSFAAVSDLAGIVAGSRVWVPGPVAASMNSFALVHASWVGAIRADSVSVASHAVLTPGALDWLLDEGAPSGLTVVVAGDALSSALATRALGAGLTVHHYYGAAELSFVGWGGHADDLWPFPGVEVEARAGELWVRSPYLCQGYDGAAGPLVRDTQGWSTVGDRGAVVGGRLLVHGRPDAVVTGGATVRTAEVETVLRAAARGEVFVVGVPHPTLGAVLVGVLTDPADRVAVVARSRDGLTAAARPRRWVHAARLPLTAAGKVDRAALAAAVAHGAEGLRPLTGNTVVP